MHIKAVLSNAAHPEYGQLSVPLPIPTGQYDEIMCMLEQLEIGDVLARDCRADELHGDVPILKRLEKAAVNIDELDYLAKRLDSFIDSELAQFQAAAVDYDVYDVPGLINLTFCCQQVTVITDFSDLEQIGKDHVLTVNGAMSMDEFDRIDFRKEALKLILNEQGRVTPYGVVYDNGMRMSDLYDGRYFPEYNYRADILTLAVSSKQQPEDTQEIIYLYLPATDIQIERALSRGGIDELEDAHLRYIESDFPKEVDAFLDRGSVRVTALNDLALAYSGLDSHQRKMIVPMMELAQPQSVTELSNLLCNAALFDHIPSIKTAEDYGKYMIRQSGRFDYDPELDECYDYKKYGEHRLAQELGAFTASGYICYQGFVSIEEMLAGVDSGRFEADGPAMGGMEMGGLS